ncbi:hypothetical protein J8L70_09695 [Pseudoalteromonas sp. MMG010]|uniref:outer membrane beta-barrel protein n=1 Tax=Pseudoalteromonas sp. MMG010 TaxID=2822685 RepID=UPI001B39EDCE|nr:outer membrane beta-barrel protein [Pseudoalteromonas sp. MMG010]MBQ4833511.1 hypothetical protein [Pseudoalteromonas sp. MMG010]
MKKAFHYTLLISSLILTAQVQANEPNSTNRHWSVGAGTQAFSIVNTDNSDNNVDFTGLNIAAGYAINDYFQVRASYFTSENKDLSILESQGFDLMAYGGFGLATTGFKSYGGAGFFSDKWTINNQNYDSFKGLQLAAGVGYNWGSVGVDFVFKLRDATKYEHLSTNDGTYFAPTGALVLFYNF